MLGLNLFLAAPAPPLMFEVSRIPARSGLSRRIISIRFKSPLEHVFLRGRDRTTGIKYSLRALKAKAVVRDVIMCDILRDNLRNEALELLIS
tara:strand:+ start:915 stop:1190 length:276 start_codon:yes stop_codon:yes gene_type:complete